MAETLNTAPVMSQTPAILSCGVTYDDAAAPLVVDRSGFPEPKNAWERLQRAVFARSNVLRSSPIRIGLAFWVVFCVTLLISGYGFYEALQQRAVGHFDKTLMLRQSLINTMYETCGIEVVSTFTTQRDRDAGPMTEPLGFYIQAADGSRIAGNVSSGAGAPGFRTLLGAEIGLDSENDYRFLTWQLDGNEISIGRSLQPLADLRAVATHCLLWALGVSIVLSVLAAVWITRRFNCRMSGLGQALALVADGNLAARVPLSSSMDDIDDMALHVNAALDRLQENVDNIRQVSTDIAHDLKTPLNRLYTYLDEAHQHVENLDGEPAKAVRVALDEATGEAEHINSTFEALLRITQIEAGSRRASFAPFDLSETLTLAHEVYEAVAEESGQKLRKCFAQATRLPVHGDQELIMQLVVNLMENAIHHCPEGAIVDIDGGSTASGGVWASISDTGPGIPVDERNKVFRRLYRLERSRTTRGTGLGLSMVKAIADLHGATVELSDNEPGLKITLSFENQRAVAKPVRAC